MGFKKDNFTREKPKPLIGTIGKVDSLSGSILSDNHKSYSNIRATGKLEGLSEAKREMLLAEKAMLELSLKMIIGNTSTSSHIIPSTLLTSPESHSKKLKAERESAGGEDLSQSR